MSKRKQCMVWVDNLDSKIRCFQKIKPGTSFCKEHFETHEIRWVKCTGEAHSNPYIDHCMVCLPHWGRYPVAVKKGSPKIPNELVDG